jgi:hypothetical protein
VFYEPLATFYYVVLIELFLLKVLECLFSERHFLKQQKTEAESNGRLS